MNPNHTALLPCDARFPTMHSRLTDGRLSPATARLGQAPNGVFDDEPDDSPALLFDLDSCDTACHPHAQRAASAVVASRLPSSPSIIITPPLTLARLACLMLAPAAVPSPSGVVSLTRTLTNPTPPSLPSLTLSTSLQLDVARPSVACYTVV